MINFPISARLPLHRAQLTSDEERQVLENDPILGLDE